MKGFSRVVWLWLYTETHVLLSRSAETIVDNFCQHKGSLPSTVS